MERPKLEIVRPDDENLDVWVGGKRVASATYYLYGSAGMAAVERTARAVAKALGADVEEVDDPSPQPYRYFITYAYTAGPHLHGVGSVWHERSTPIEDAESEREAREVIERGKPHFDTVVITNFVLVDGPC